MVPPTESLRFVASKLGESGRNLEQIGAKFLGLNHFGFFFKTWRNAYLHVHDLGHIGKLEANLDSFKTALRRNREEFVSPTLFPTTLLIIVMSLMAHFQRRTHC